MDAAALKEVIRLHGLWRAGDYSAGKRADLSGANLRCADLSSADLRSADLSGADLSSADLRSADLSGAYLSGADLSGADLRGAIGLATAKGNELAIAMTRVVPREGIVYGWKKCCNNKVVKLLIPADARRSNAFGRKCRAERAEVLEVLGGGQAHSMHDIDFIYEAGKTVTPRNGWGEDFAVECAPGIHFFMTREEAEAFTM